MSTLVGASAVVTIVQHGYAHRNHAPPGARSCELGAHRPVASIVAELREGREQLERRFGTRFAAFLVPPWNRIAPEVVAQLPTAGFCGLSTFGPRREACPVPGLVQCNTHVDLIAWRSGRGFIGADETIARLIDHLRARREGRADAAEPTGVLTHHLDLTEDAWQFLAELFLRTRDCGMVDWLDARAAFAAPSPPPVTSARSA